MIPLLRRLLHALLWDELAARRWARGLLLGWSGCGLGFADQLAGLVDAPGAVQWIRVSAVVTGAIAGMVTAGERNVRPPGP